MFAAMRRFSRVFVALILLALPLFFLTRVGTHVPPYAATSDNLNFQARLQTSTGAIVPDGFYNVEFKLYDDPSAAPFFGQRLATTPTVSPQVTTTESESSTTT